MHWQGQSQQRHLLATLLPLSLLGPPMNFVLLGETLRLKEEAVFICYRQLFPSRPAATPHRLENHLCRGASAAIDERR